MDRFQWAVAIIASIAGLWAWALGYVIGARRAEHRHAHALEALNDKDRHAREGMAAQYRDQLSVLMQHQQTVFDGYTSFVREVGGRLVPEPVHDSGELPKSVAEVDLEEVRKTRGEVSSKSARPRIEKSARDGR